MQPTTLSRLHTSEEFVLSARGGQRGPDEETEMNFMSAGQCPAVKAQELHDGVNAARSASKFQCTSPLMPFLHVRLCRRTRLSEKVALVAKIRKHIISNYCDHFLTHVSHNAPRQGVAGAASATLACFGAAALQGSLATASGRRRARLRKYKTVEVPETWHTGRAQRGLHFD